METTTTNTSARPLALAGFYRTHNEPQTQIPAASPRDFSGILIETDTGGRPVGNGRTINFGYRHSRGPDGARAGFYIGTAPDRSIPVPADRTLYPDLSSAIAALRASDPDASAIIPAGSTLILRTARAGTPGFLGHGVSPIVIPDTEPVTPGNPGDDTPAETPAPRRNRKRNNG